MHLVNAPKNGLLRSQEMPPALITTAAGPPADAARWLTQPLAISGRKPRRAGGRRSVDRRPPAVPPRDSARQWV